jgi:hypothetical protein
LEHIETYYVTKKNLELMLGGEGETKPVVFTDANWASQSDYHLILGYATIIGAGAVT